MDIFQVVGIAFLGAILSLVVKQYKPEMSILIVIVTGIILFSLTFSGISTIFSEIKGIMNMGGIDEKYFYIILKIIGIAYLVELSGELCRDMGENAIALKLEAVGKIFVMLLALPIIKSFLEVCINAISLL